MLTENEPRFTEDQERRALRTMEQLRACGGDYRRIGASIEQKRLAWWEANHGKLRLSGSLVRQAYTLFLLDYLGLVAAEVRSCTRIHRDSIASRCCASPHRLAVGQLLLDAGGLPAGRFSSNEELWGMLRSVPHQRRTMVRMSRLISTGTSVPAFQRAGQQHQTALLSLGVSINPRTVLHTGRRTFWWPCRSPVVPSFSTPSFLSSKRQMFGIAVLRSGADEKLSIPKSRTHPPFHDRNKHGAWMSSASQPSIRHPRRFHTSQWHRLCVELGTPPASCSRSSGVPFRGGPRGPRVPQVVRADLTEPSPDSADAGTHRRAMDTRRNTVVTTVTSQSWLKPNIGKPIRSIAPKNNIR